MKDFLLDIVEHVLPTGVINLVKITGDDKSTVVTAISEDKTTLIFRGTFHTPQPEFEGVFGLPNLTNLATILNIPEYRDNANIYIKKENVEGVDKPRSIQFDNASGDFNNNFRLMVDYLVSDKVRDVKFNGTTWNITMEPTVASISRLKYQSQAHSAYETFTARSDGNDLRLYFGDPSGHAGDFVFQSGVSGKLSGDWQHRVTLFQSILNLSGDKVIQFSDDGVILITVDSGLVKYEYFLPALTK
jgi:hypothetical protein